MLVLVTLQLQAGLRVNSWFPVTFDLDGSSLPVNNLLFPHLERKEFLQRSRILWGKITLLQCRERLFDISVETRTLLSQLVYVREENNAQMFGIILAGLKGFSQLTDDCLSPLALSFCEIINQRAGLLCELGKDKTVRAYRCGGVHKGVPVCLCLCRFFSLQMSSGRLL